MYHAYMLFRLLAFGSSITVDSDISPKVLENTVKKEIVKILGKERLYIVGKHTDMNTILGNLVKRNIYSDDDSNKIDFGKLTEVLVQANLNFLLDANVYGVQVVAFAIRRHQQLHSASNYIRQLQSENVSNDVSDRNNKRRRNTGKKKKEGGEEVFNMFTSQKNQCVINNDLIKKIQHLASTQSTTDYNVMTQSGKLYPDCVEQDIQSHMDLYYKGHKSMFPKRDFEAASNNMPVYIKIMYYVQRGLVRPFERVHQEYVNAYWGKIGTFFNIYIYNIYSCVCI